MLWLCLVKVEFLLHFTSQILTNDDCHALALFFIYAS